MSAGLDSVVKQSDGQPVLAVHQGFTSAGSTLAGVGAGPLVRPGHLLVANTKPGSFGRPVLIDGLLHADGPGGPVRPTGVDFLTLWLECRAEHDSWRLAAFDELVRAAGTAYLNGQADTFRALRTQAVVAAWNSTDFIQTDRVRVAKFLADQIDEVKVLGATGRPIRALDAVAQEQMPDRQDPELRTLRLGDLLA